MTNTAKYYTRNALFALGLLFSNGALLQSFLRYCGITDSQIGVYTGIINGVITVAMLLLAKFLDGLPDVKKAAATILLPVCAVAAAMLPFCFFNVNAKAMFTTVLAVGTVQAVFIGMRNTLEYKLPYWIIDMSHYSTLTAVDSVVTGSVTVGFSALFTALTGVLPYKYLMAGGFAFAVLCMLSASVLTASLKTSDINHTEQAPSAHAKLSSGDILRDDSFRKLSLPNILRGVPMGVLGVGVLIGYNDAGFTESTAAAFVTVTTLSAILGGLTYAFISKKFKIYNIILFSALLAAVSFPLMLTGGATAFLIFYFFSNYALNIYGFTMPVSVCMIIPYEKIGRYTSWRLAFTNIGVSAASALTGILLGKVATVWILAVCSAMQLYCGLAYYFYMKRRLTSQS